MKKKTTEIIIDALPRPLQSTWRYPLYCLLEEAFKGQITPEDLNRFIQDYAFVARDRGAFVTGKRFALLWREDPFHWRLYLAHKHGDAGATNA